MLRKNRNLEILKMNLRTNRAFRALKSMKDSTNGVTWRPLDFLVRQIDKNNVDLVLDVGANLGQFARDLMISGYSNKIESFEPVKAQFEFLKKISQRNNRWEAHNFAFGDRMGEREIFLTSNSGLSSSFLEMNNNHFDNFPATKIVGVEKVQIKTIYDFITEYKIDPKRTLLKLDVQGFESKVLAGCQDQLEQFALCFIEVSLIPLYNKELTLLEILDFLSKNGQQLIDVRRGVKSKNGDLLQLDVLTRSNSSEAFI